MAPPSTQITQPHRSIRFSPWERIGLLSLGFVLSTLLALASWLTPDPMGLGTHRQLGLPGCTLYTILGIRCPGCGMTTSWAHTLNGDIANGLDCNIAGVLLCFLTVGLVPCLFGLAILGEPSRQSWVFRVSIFLLIAILSISIFEWLIRLAFTSAV